MSMIWKEEVNEFTCPLCISLKCLQPQRNLSMQKLHRYPFFCLQTGLYLFPIYPILVLFIPILLLLMLACISTCFHDPSYCPCIQLVFLHSLCNFFAIAKIGQRNVSAFMIRSLCIIKQKSWFFAFRRGKPLFLSDERYARLQQQWLTHSFDRTCKRWGLHNGKL